MCENVAVRRGIGLCGLEAHPRALHHHDHRRRAGVERLAVAQPDTVGARVHDAHAHGLWNLEP